MGDVRAEQLGDLGEGELDRGKLLPAEREPATNVVAQLRDRLRPVRGHCLLFGGVALDAPQRRMREWALRAHSRLSRLRPAPRGGDQGQARADDQEPDPRH